MTCGQKLTQLRKQKGLSQKQLANLLNVSRQAISRWEMDLTLPDASNLIKLNDIFNVSIDYLLKENVTSKKQNHTLDDILSSIKKPKDYKHIGDLLFISVIPLFLFGIYCHRYDYEFWGNLIIMISGLNFTLSLYFWYFKK